MGEARDTLKRLLEAERQAQVLVDQAIQKRDRIIQQALADTRKAEERFAVRIPELQQSFMSEAESRAEQTISELAQHYEDCQKQLEILAQECRAEAAKIVLARFLDPMAYP